MTLFPVFQPCFNQRNPIGLLQPVDLPWLREARPFQHGQTLGILLWRPLNLGILQSPVILADVREAGPMFQLHQCPANGHVTGSSRFTPPFEQSSTSPALRAA
jgi:hypothetical protein